MAPEDSTAADRAYFDQAKATAREIGRTDPTKWVLVIEAISSSENTQCCWCSCPDPDQDQASAHWQRDYVCPGCPERAEVRLLVGHGSPRESHYPLCADHLDGALEFVARLTAMAGTGSTS